MTGAGARGAIIAHAPERAAHRAFGLGHYIPSPPGEGVARSATGGAAAQVSASFSASAPPVIAPLRAALTHSPSGEGIIARDVVGAIVRLRTLEAPRAQWARRWRRGWRTRRSRRRRRG